MYIYNISRVYCSGHASLYVFLEWSRVLCSSSLSFSLLKHSIRFDSIFFFSFSIRADGLPKLSRKGGVNFWFDGSTRYWTKPDEDRYASLLRPIIFTGTDDWHAFRIDIMLYADDSCTIHRLMDSKRRRVLYYIILITGSWSRYKIV